MGVIQSPPQKGGLAGINLAINQFQCHRSLLWEEPTGVARNSLYQGEWERLRFS